jgi:chromosome segregation ATPase
MDEQVEILRAIWNEMKSLNGRVNTTNSRLDETNSRLDETNSRLEETNSRLYDLRDELKAEIGALRVETKAEIRELRAELNVVHNRSVDRDLRLATSLAELSRDVRELTLLVHDWRDEHRLDRHELRERVARLERHTGLEPQR